MFDNFIALFETDIVKAIYVAVGMLVVLALNIWVCAIDIKRQKIAFWKLLIAGGSTIIVTFIGSFLCDCPKLKWYLLLSIPIWIAILFINIKFNKAKIVGRGDIDIFSALISLTVAYSVWLYNVSQPEIALINISYIWYNFFLTMLIGSVLVVSIYLIRAIILSIKNKQNILKYIIGVKISVLLMFLPTSVVMPMIFLTM